MRARLTLPLAFILTVALGAGLLAHLLYGVNLGHSATHIPSATPTGTSAGSREGGEPMQASGWLVASQRSGAGALVGVNLTTGQVVTLAASPQALLASPLASSASPADASLTWRALSYSVAARTFVFTLDSQGDSAQSLWVTPEVKDASGMPQMQVNLARELLSPCEGPCLQPALSPSGDLALVDGLDFTRSAPIPSIEMLSVPSGAPRVVVTGDSPACSPDGAWLAYTPSVDEPTQLTLSPAQDCVPTISGAGFVLTSSANFFDDSWSSDGQFLAFTLADPWGGATGSRVYVVPLGAIMQAKSHAFQGDVLSLAYPVSAAGCSNPVWIGSNQPSAPALLTYSCATSADVREAVEPGSSGAQPVLWRERLVAPQGFTWPDLQILSWLPA